MTWRLEGAACADLTPDESDRVFFTRGTSPTARRLCAACPVQSECLADVLAVERGLPLKYRGGFRAGMTTGQRYALGRGLRVVA